MGGGDWVAKMQEDTAKLMVKEENKGRAGEPSKTKEEGGPGLLYAQEDLFNPMVEYNIAVLYSYTKNFAFAINSAVKLLAALDSSRDHYLYFKTAFFLLVLAIARCRTSSRASTRTTCPSL